MDSALQASKKGRGLKFVRINAGPMGADDLEVVVSSPSSQQLRSRLQGLRSLLPSLADSLTRSSAQLKSKHLDGIVIPKVNSAADVQAVDALINSHGLEKTKASLRIIASIESPLALMNLKEVRPPLLFPELSLTSLSRSQPLRSASIPSSCVLLLFSVRLANLISYQFASEDYCATSNLLRTSSRHEMAYARSAIVAHAKAYGLQAIDLVCVAYNDFEVPRLGFGSIDGS